MLFVMTGYWTIDGYRVVYHLGYLTPLVFSFTTLRWFEQPRNIDLQPILVTSLFLLISLIVLLKFYPNPFGWKNGTIAIFLYVLLGLLSMIIYNHKLHNGLISLNLAFLSIGACREIYEIGWWIHTNRFVEFLIGLKNPLIINSSLVAFVVLIYALLKLKWKPNVIFYISCFCYVLWSCLWAVYGLEKIVGLTFGILPRVIGMLLFLSLPFGIQKEGSETIESLCSRRL